MTSLQSVVLKADINRIYDEKYREASAVKPKKHYARPEKKPKSRKNGWFIKGMGIDLPFLLIILVLLIIGMIMMFSASYPVAYYTQNDSYYYLKRQIVFAVIGVAAMLGLSFFNYNKLHKIAPFVLGLSARRQRRTPMDRRRYFRNSGFGNYKICNRFVFCPLGQ